MCLITQAILNMGQQPQPPHTSNDTSNAVQMLLLLLLLLVYMHVPCSRNLLFGFDYC